MSYCAKCGRPAIGTLDPVTHPDQRITLRGYKIPFYGGSKLEGVYTTTIPGERLMVLCDACASRLSELTDRMVAAIESWWQDKPSAMLGEEP